jgi:hypothetical protein
VLADDPVLGRSWTGDCRAQGGYIDYQFHIGNSWDCLVLPIFELKISSNAVALTEQG